MYVYQFQSATFYTYDCNYEVSNKKAIPQHLYTYLQG